MTWAVRTMGRSGMEHEDGISSVLARRELSYPPVTITLDSLKVTVPVESDSVVKVSDVRLFVVTKSGLPLQCVSAGVHSTVNKYSQVDPRNIFRNLSIDVKGTVLRET